MCVKGTVPYGSADEAGIEPGDYILSVDGKEVTSPIELKKLIASMTSDAQGTNLRFNRGYNPPRNNLFTPSFALGRASGTQPKSSQVEIALLGSLVPPRSSNLVFV